MVAQVNHKICIKILLGVNVGNNKDYGLYWVKSQRYDIVLEIHLDAAGESASGGHVIISSQFNADTIDKSIQDVIKII